MKQLIMLLGLFFCYIVSTIAQITIHGVTLPEKLCREDKVGILYLT